MNFHLVFYHDSKGRGIWTIPTRYRIVAACVCTILCTSLFLQIIEGTPVSIFQFILTLCALAATLYREQWILDPVAQTATLYIGLVLCAKKYKHLAFSDIESVGMLTVYRNKKPYRCAARLLLTENAEAHMTKGKSEFTLDTAGSHHREKLKEACQKTAELIGVDFHDDSADKIS